MKIFALLAFDKGLAFKIYQYCGLPILKKDKTLNKDQNDKK